MPSARHLAIVIALLGASAAVAEELTPDPQAWRPFRYADLGRPSADKAVYADIWRDKLDANNVAYAVRGDRRYLGRMAPATEAHFTIASRQKTVVASVLNTVSGCAAHLRDAVIGAAVMLCPMRIAIYEGARVRTFEAAPACYLELQPQPANLSSDPARSVSYASYDATAKVLRLGMIVNHKAVDGCQIRVSLTP